MKIQLIIIGNELLNGKISDRNTAYLAKKAFENNFQLIKTHIIGDDSESFFRALNEAWKESDLVLTSGGLGPTKDDLTKSMLADFFQKKLKKIMKHWNLLKRFMPIKAKNILRRLLIITYPKNLSFYIIALVMLLL